MQSILHFTLFILRLTLVPPPGGSKRFLGTTRGWLQEISWNHPPTLIYGATDYVSNIVYTRDVRFENRHGFMSHNEDVPLIGKQMGEVCVMLFVCIKIIQFPYKYIPLPIHFTLIIFDTQQLYCLIFLWIYLTFSWILVLLYFKYLIRSDNV